MPPRFSVFIPTRNDAQWLAASIGSVLQQSIADWELVIGDNVSSDPTRDVASLEDPRVRYHRWDTVVDVNANFNRTAGLCQGDWLVPIGADDRLLPEALETFDSAIEADADLVMVVAACRRIDQDGAPAAATWRFYQRKQEVAEGTYDAGGWLNAVCLDGQPPWNVGSIAFHRRTVERLGGLLNPDAGPASDIELVLRMALGGPVRYLQAPVLVYTQRTDSDHRIQQRSNRQGDDETILGRGLRIGYEAHRRHRGRLPRHERAAIHAAIARSYLQRAAQHRLLVGGGGRSAAWQDVRRAWRTSRSTLVSPRQLLVVAGSLFGPGWVLRSASRLLRQPQA